MNTINGVEITTENMNENASLAAQVTLLLFGAEMEINGRVYGENEYSEAKAALASIGYTFQQ